MMIMRDITARQLPSRDNGYRKIEAIYTEYDWRVYRSQLEAKWAAFFATLPKESWRIQYEPRSYARYWLPDFEFIWVGGQCPFSSSTCLVEIKPTLEIAQNELAKHIGDIYKVRYIGRARARLFLLVGTPPENLNGLPTGQIVTPIRRKRRKDTGFYYWLNAYLVKPMASMDCRDRLKFGIAYRRGEVVFNYKLESCQFPIARYIKRRGLVA